MGVSGLLHAPADLPQHKEPLVPIGYHSRSQACEKENNLWPLSGIELRFFGPPAGNQSHSGAPISRYADMLSP